MLRLFFGGIGDEAILSEPDERSCAIAREELRAHFGFDGGADVSHDFALAAGDGAVYGGPRQRVQEIRDRAAAIPGLHLAGNAYEGIGIPDCVPHGTSGSEEDCHRRQRLNQPEIH